jgi:hypothetical protein
LKLFSELSQQSINNKYKVNHFNLLELIKREFPGFTPHSIVAKLWTDIAQLAASSPSPE